MSRKRRYLWISAIFILGIFLLACNGTTSKNDESITKLREEALQSFYEDSEKFNTIEEAEKASGIKILIPKNTLGGEIKDILYNKKEPPPIIYLIYDNDIVVSTSPKDEVLDYKILKDLMKEKQASTIPNLIKIKGFEGISQEYGYIPVNNNRSYYPSGVRWYVNKTEYVVASLDRKISESELIRVAESAY